MWRMQGSKPRYHPHSARSHPHLCISHPLGRLSSFLMEFIWHLSLFQPKTRHESYGYSLVTTNDGYFRWDILSFCFIIFSRLLLIDSVLYNLHTVAYRYRTYSVIEHVLTCFYFFSSADPRGFKIFGIWHLSYHQQFSVFSLLLTDTFCGWGFWSMTKWPLPVSINQSPSLLLFRFIIDGHPLRLMLLSKDKQNLLKIVSFDFLVVCMQVSSFLKYVVVIQCSRSGSGSNSFCLWLSRCRKICKKIFFFAV